MDESISLVCGDCQRKLRVSAEHAGKRVRCPGCQAVVVIPAKDTAAPAGASPATDALRLSRPLKPLPSGQKPATPPAGSGRPPQRKAAAAPPRREAVHDDMWDDGGLSDSPYAEPPMDSNPFAAPRSFSAPPAAATLAGQRGFTIDGSLICCGSGVTLPPVCIRTGATQNLIPVTKTLKHSPPWAFLVGGAILALVMQKSCVVTYCISPETKKRQSTIMLIGATIAVVGILLLLVDAIALQSGIGVLLGVLGIMAGLITALASAQALKIAKRKGSTTFWIKGCKPPFFEVLANSGVR